MTLRKHLLPFTLGCCLLFPMSGNAQAWEAEVELYLLATTIEGDAGIGQAQNAPVSLDFDAILENLDMAGMVHFEIFHESGWGAALDYSFMDLGYDRSGPYGGVVDAGVRQGVFQADLLYRMPIIKGSIDWLGGIRWWDNDFDVKVDTTVLPGPVDLSREEDWIDVFVGARLIFEITESWNLMLRGDIGGFGLEADFTAQVYGNLRWMIAEKWAFDIGYKALWVDYETGHSGQRDYFNYDTLTHGPQLGIIYKF